MRKPIIWDEERSIGNEKKVIEKGGSDPEGNEPIKPKVTNEV